MNLSKTNYIKFLQRFSGRFINFMEDGNGIIMRHDVDDMLDVSVRMAEIEADYGVKATYFILNTAPYWEEDKQLWPKLKHIQELGHEIGWHNNAITEWWQMKQQYNLFAHIAVPVMDFEYNGIRCIGSASHGDPLCYELGYLNYSVFKGCVSNDPLFNKLQHEVFDMDELNLEYEAYFTKRDDYLSESGGAWSKDPATTLDKWHEENKRYQLLIHPQWWQV